MVKLSERINKISLSPTLNLLKSKNALVAQGKKVLDFGAGEPDFPTPDNIKIKGIEAINSNFTKYTAATGIPELKQSISEYYQVEMGYKPRISQVTVTPGSKYGCFMILQALLDPGDEVILPLPYWVTYPELVRYSEGVIVYADHINEDPLFTITAESYISKYTAKTKVILINSPSNPTGKIMANSELEKVIDFFYKKGVFIIVDDCYRNIVYETEILQSPFTLVPEAADHIAVLGSLSKSFSMTGWRIGYTIAPDHITGALAKLQGHSTSNPCSISQKAAIEALDGEKPFLAKMVAEYKRRRDFMAERFDQIGNIKYSLPNGAFYFFPDFSYYINKKNLRDDNELAMQILNELNIILVPGSAFGAKNYIRISYATGYDDIKAGLDKIESFLYSGWI